MHRALFAFLVAVLPAVARAQVVMGRVVDAQTGQPLPVAGVGVRISPDSVVRTRTGADGVFALELGAPGRYVVHIQASLEAFASSDTIDVPKDSVVQREFRVPMPADPVFFEYQVDKPVAPIPTPNTGPRYPTQLRAQKVDGEVFASFEVDTAGRVDTATFRVIRQTHAEFAASVREALPGLRFRPAERQGRPVRQLVEQPFGFCVSDRPRKDGPCGGRPLQILPSLRQLGITPPDE
jgi:TonB family protein